VTGPAIVPQEVECTSVTLNVHESTTPRDREGGRFVGYLSIDYPGLQASHKDYGMSIPETLLRLRQAAHRLFGLHL
jgi:hypothetical protein